MRLAKYRKLEKEILFNDRGSIESRWRYGRFLLCDDTATTPEGHLKHGRIEKLILAAREENVKLSEREIQRRLQCGRTYPMLSQIRHIVADFETWRDLSEANFPDIPCTEKEPPYDPRTMDHRQNQHDHRGSRLFERATQGSFPFDGGTILADVGHWLDEQDRITHDFAVLGIKRRAHFEQLVNAVDGDLTKTLDEAQAALGEDLP